MTLWITVTGWTLVHFLWQGSAIGGAAATGLFLLRGAGPNARYMLATSALALMLLSPIVTATWISAATPTHGITVPTSALAPLSSTTPAIESVGLAMRPTGLDADRYRVARALPLIVMVWLTGVSLLLVRLLGGWWWVRRLHRDALGMPPSRWQATVDRLAARLPVRRAVYVRDSLANGSPVVVGWWRPVLLLPVTAFAGLTPAQAESVLTHELAHIHRHDYLINILQHVTETALFYHPAVRWISHRMRVERELCCDAIAVASGHDALDYATALALLDEARVDGAVLAVAAARGALVDRIRRILDVPRNPDHPGVHPILTALIVAALIAAVGGGAHWSIRTLHATGRRTMQSRNEAARPSSAAPNWLLYTTRHVDVFFTPDLSAQLERVEGDAERAYQRISNDLRHDLGARLVFVLFADGAAARAASATTLPNEPAGQRRTLLPLDRSDADLQTLVAHEITHAFELDIVPAVINTAPKWILEGLSEYEGGAWGANDPALLRALVGSNAVPALSTFDAGVQNAPRLTYSVGHAAFDFVATRWGVDGIRRLLFALRSGSIDRQLLYPTAFGISADEFDRAFAAYARDRFPSA